MIVFFCVFSEKRLVFALRKKGKWLFDSLKDRGNFALKVGHISVKARHIRGPYLFEYKDVSGKETTIKPVFEISLTAFFLR